MLKSNKILLQKINFVFTYLILLKKIPIPIFVTSIFFLIKNLEPSKTDYVWIIHFKIQ